MIHWMKQLHVLSHHNLKIRSRRILLSYSRRFYQLLYLFVILALLEDGERNFPLSDVIHYIPGGNPFVGSHLGRGGNTLLQHCASQDSQLEVNSWYNVHVQYMNIIKSGHNKIRITVGGTHKGLHMH